MESPVFSEQSTDTMSQPPKHKIKRKHLLGRNFLKFYHIFCRVVCMLTLVTQCALIDYYLVVYHNVLWALWIIADLVIVVMFCIMFAISYRFLKRRPLVVMPAKMRECLGELPLTYITWFFYSGLVSAKICVLYGMTDSIAGKLEEKFFFGPNMLRTAISLSSIILYLVVLTSHDTRSRSPQNEFIMSVVGSVYIDILDSTQFLGSIREDSSVLTHALRLTILGVICFNFILPTEALIVLSKKHFGKITVSLRDQMLHKIIYFLVVNIPIFVVRLLIWHRHDQNVSVFLVKNVLAIGLAIKDIHEFTINMYEVIKDELHLEDIDVGLASDKDEKKRKDKEEEFQMVVKEVNGSKSAIDA